MRIRLVILLTIALYCAGCGALATEIGHEMAPQISTEVAIQVGTALAVTSVPAGDLSPAATAVLETAFDCERKTCGSMASCEEAVYKLNTCGQSQLDRNGDGVPCEAICTAAEVQRITGSAPVTRGAEAPAAAVEEIGRVTRVVDGDTIDVLIDGRTARVRYLQMNTPERDEPCYREATQANADLVQGETVRLVPDVELVDPFGRLLRYIFVDDVLVNRVLVEQGYAEVALYPPNDKHYDEFALLEAEAAAAGRGCHPTGIFDDGSTRR